MANHKSAIKRHLQSEKSRLRNKDAKSAMRTQVKKARTEISAGGASGVAGEVQAAVSALAKAASKGIIPKNTAARKASRLMKAANK